MDVVWDSSDALLNFEVSVFGGTRILKTSGMMGNSSAHDVRSQRHCDHWRLRRSRPRMRNHRDGERHWHVGMMYGKSHHEGGIYRDGFEGRRDCDGLGMGNWNGSGCGGLELGNWNGSGYGGVGVYVYGSDDAYDGVNYHRNGRASSSGKMENQGNAVVFLVDDGGGVLVEG